LESINITRNKILEIEWLRGLAVISVILNHINERIFPNGYLGVDIFFVISGYLILRSFSKKNFIEFGDFISTFYLNRLKRLLPALIAFTFVSSILISFFNPFPGESLKTGVFSLLGLSNFFLYFNSIDYFSNSTELNVFTHTWSLSVEAQIYFLSPILFLIISSNSKEGNKLKNFCYLSLVLGSISLIGFISFYSKDQSFAYFSMFTRFWEIAAGFFLFYLSDKINFIKRHKNYSFLILIMMLLLMGLPLLIGYFLNIAIVFLTGLLILSILNRDKPIEFFNNKIIVFLGTISYSLYLWHWGILSISRWTIGIHWWTLPFQGIILVSISILSYRYIEIPYKENYKTIGNSYLFLKWFRAIFVSILGLVILGIPLKGKLYLGSKVNNNNFIIADDFEPYFEYFDISEDICYNNKKNEQINPEFVFSECSDFTNKNNRTLFFIGDSHNYKIMMASELIAKKSFSNLFTYAIQGEIFPAIEFHYTSKEESYMRDSIKAIEEKILEETKSGDIVILTLRMPFYFVYKQKLEEWVVRVKDYADRLSAKGVNLIIFMPTPEFPDAVGSQCSRYNAEWFNRLNRTGCSFPISKFISEDKTYSSIRKELEELSKNENIFLFDALRSMCPNELCSYTYDKNALYFDTNHMTNFAALNLIPKDLLKLIEKIGQ